MTLVLRSLLTFLIFATPLQAFADRRNDSGLPAVLELYTSQSCTMCPKANRQFSDFARENAHTGLIALTFPVGYWDYLGWKDTFAQPVFDQRQKNYNKAMGRRGPYTPQVIFNGSDHCSATRAKSMAKELEKTQLDRPKARISYNGATATIQPVSDASRSTAADSEVWLVEFLPGETVATPTKGANKGKEMVYFNRVTRLERLGAWTGDAVMMEAPCPRACAVLVQGGDHREIHAAAQFIN